MKLSMRLMKIRAKAKQKRAKKTLKNFIKRRRNVMRVQMATPMRNRRPARRMGGKRRGKR